MNEPLQISDWHKEILQVTPPANLFRRIKRKITNYYYFFFSSLEDKYWYTIKRYLFVLNYSILIIKIQPGSDVVAGQILSLV